MSAGRDASQATALGRYLRETGTVAAWLAEQVGMSTSKITRVVQGTAPLKMVERDAIMAALRARLEIPLDGLLDDQRYWTPPKRPRPRAGVPESPFDRLSHECKQ